MIFTSDVPYYVSLSGAYYPELSEDDITLEEGESKKLKVNGTRSGVRWSGSKKSVATVNSQGVVKAKKPGEAVITAKCGEYTLECYVTVEKKPATYKAIAKKMKAFARKNKYFEFKTMLEQNSLYVWLNSTYGTGIESLLSAAERKNWSKLLKEYQALLKEY